LDFNIEILAILGTILIAVITSIIGPLIIIGKKNKGDSLKDIQRKKLISDIKTHKAINAQIHRLQKECLGERIFIIQFHNGGNYFPTGKSIQKMSISYERVSKNNIKSLKHIIQSLPVSLYPNILSDIQNNIKIYITPENKFEYEDIFSIGKLPYTYMEGLFNDVGTMIGIISIGYEDYDTFKTKIPQTAPIIGNINGLIELYLND